MGTLDSLKISLQTLGGIGKILIFLGILLCGWIVGSGFGQAIKRFSQKIRIHSLLKRTGIESVFLKMNIPLNAPNFFREVIRWSIFLIFLVFAFDAVGFRESSALIREIVKYLPNVYVAILIFFVAIFLTDLSYKVVLVSSEKAKLKYSRLIGNIVRAIVWLFAILAILLQLNIASRIIEPILYGSILTLALVFGLSFGLGGKDLAKEILEDIKEKLS